MNGVLVVDKPAGPTSHDVVARVRRATGVARIGHTGTLDPLATGVLPLVLGRATRLAQFLSGSDKEYLAEVRFGSATSTYDAEGEPAPPGARRQSRPTCVGRSSRCSNRGRTTRCRLPSRRKRWAERPRTGSRAGTGR
jgi:tRNA U55 pseudouridine synthase TruB